MKLIKLDNVRKKDIPLHYRNEFSCQARFSSLRGSTKQEIKHPVEFAIERSALGKTEITVKVLEDVDYPLVPLIKTLKNHIFDLHQKGLLP